MNTERLAMWLAAYPRRKFFCLALAALALGALPAHAEPPGDGGKIRLLYNEGGTNSFIPFTIRKFGLDKKHGFELIPIPTTTPAAGMTAMKAGAADAHTFGWNEIARMNNSGIPVIGVAPFLRWGADFILVSKDSPIKTIGDLKGKKVGTNSRTALNWVAMMAVGEKKFGLTEKEMTIHEGAPPLLRALLEQGSLDATHMFNSVTPSMIVSGKTRVLAKISDLINEFGMPDTPFLLYAFDTKYVAAKPQNVKAFVAAYQDAVQILRTDDQVWLDRGRELQFPDEASALFRKEARTDIWSRFEPDTEAKIKKVFAAYLPVAGPEVLGIATLPDGFMTVAFQ
ncbi:MAG: ABC transporter substrate-binding protein [Xanthobacteraceae bacterium]